MFGNGRPAPPASKKAVENLPKVQVTEAQEGNDAIHDFIRIVSFFDMLIFFSFIFMYCIYCHFHLHLCFVCFSNNE